MDVIPFRHSSYTVDGKPVFRGCFWLVDTKGFPLDILVDELQERFGGVVNWEEFVSDALKAGWQWKTILSKCEEAALDLYAPIERKEFMDRLRLLLMRIGQ